MSLHKVFRAVDLWLDETKIDTASKALNLSKPTIVKLYKKFREVIGRYFIDNLERLDENNNTLEVEEVIISDQKYCNGKVIPQKCVIGIIDTVTKDVLIKHIDSRDREKLKSVIFDAVTEPSTISTDIWKEYLNVFDDVIIDYDDLNSSDNIKQLVDKADNDAISNVWFHLRNTLKKRSQTNYNNLQGYIDEFLWRRKLKNDKEDMINSFLELTKINDKINI
uniref:DDE_Tnp_IS1595 domain-containing protein n=1 Tax=Parastrongyloides trichosuri TaxID=131310 RepID=A0A0N4Z9I2_PARTI